MEIKCPFQSPYLANTYVIGNENSPCIVIDPGNNENGCLDRYIKKHHNGVVLAYLLTHGHFDHILGLSDLTYKAKIYVHEEDEIFLTDDRYNLLKGLAIKGYEVETIKDNETLKIGDSSFLVIHTPFHTSGSVCYLLDSENALFSGDTLFHLSVGRSDLPGSAPRKMESSLKKLLMLDENTKIYPGHGPSSTLKAEKRLNPYLSGL